MKTHRLLLALPAAALITGCVGYNHTLFMTKSNAGLDFDLKPPTAEVAISRKEAVIAPVFEGGKTPPVMASFGSDNGAAAGFSRFFFGVNQTFAGGDAAKAMAQLYADDQVPGTNAATTNYDSRIDVRGKPNASTNWFTRTFFGLHSTNDVRPLIFGTDTSLGVKVGWSGVSGQVPDRLHIGYGRKEMAFAPVFGEQLGDNTNIVRMPSFLATVDATVKVDTNAPLKTAYIQYFATGDSATRLAMQPAVRQAMIQRADPAAGQRADKIAEVQAGKGLLTPGDVEKKSAISKAHSVEANKTAVEAAIEESTGRKWLDFVRYSNAVDVRRAYKKLDDGNLLSK